MSADHLDIEQRQRLESLLLRERERTMRSHRRLSEMSSETPEESSSIVGRDPSDNGSHRANQENASLLASREHDKIRAIDEALRLLRDRPESYGLCETCGAPIPYGRLEFLPTTRRCSAHAD